MSEPDIRTLYTAEQVQARVRELGAEIRGAYAAGGELVLIGVLKGSFVFLADLCRAIDLPLAIDFLGIESYGDETETSGVTRITSDLTRPIQGKDVLLVEDIIDTGLTMDYLLGFLRERHPRSLRICTLLHKPARAKRQVPIDWIGFTIPNRFVLGYGLDYAQKFRNLPYIGYVEG